MAAASHGHNPAAWTGVTITFIGFCVSGVAMIMPAVWLFWVGMAVVLVGGVVGKAMSMAGMGKQPTTHHHAVATETKTAVSV
ncbi:hypothetical protein CFP65_1764 [Kitasatospora sp. MMS16-BH015]|uniref:HGxxPAAW family protein n=1 Tax=Kitasatospora sp. MMS16-BH015 TaxID=2018025 RepID=UPI000CA22B1A|nr:HGxxPAAW family protein [Kitasatospora sp. MMS16-BH015]AUG76641.1 hypothetical protein CFP65_1764 [Kitasatospora sp. MMS16-BH015]